ncbi:hypothetical protein D6779_07060 [Candidatus Parcubacteria bacterium]|nr:MAG: hypothetical protein D6779_07060 [Candidatus Parcubacteria bacterium]
MALQQVSLKLLEGADLNPGRIPSSDGAWIGSIPPGVVFPFVGPTPPADYLECNGAAVSRTTYNLLFSALTTTFTGNNTANSAIVSGIGSTSHMAPGMFVEGPGVPVGTTISTVDSATQITLSAAIPTANTGATFTLFSFGQGDGSTTFNLPDLRGEFIRGYDNGRGIDTGRAFGSWQADSFAAHSHGIGTTTVSGAGGSYFSTNSIPGGVVGVGVQSSTTGGSETRPRNVALMFCIKYQ